MKTAIGINTEIAAGAKAKFGLQYTKLYGTRRKDGTVRIKFYAMDFDNNPKVQELGPFYAYSPEQRAKRRDITRELNVELTKWMSSEYGAVEDETAPQNHSRTFIYTAK